MSDKAVVLALTGGLTTFDQGEPRAIIEAGANARFAYAEFFGDQIASDHTRKVYRHAVHRFLSWCEAQGLELTRIPPGAVGRYVRALATSDGKPASKPTQKLHLAAIRRFFDTLVQRHAVALNPATSVRGPVVRNVTGKTPATDPALARALLRSIATSDVVGLRDRAILATLMYTACRVGAVSKLRLRDFYTDGRQYYLRFDEKGGADRQIPCRHDLQGYIEEYIAAAPCGPDAPLFRAALGRTLQLSGRPLHPKDIHRMVKRRLKAAGLPAILTCHSFRATTATDLLEQGVPLEDVQELLGHADPRTTRLYDRRDRTVTRNVVERISI
ncbi:MAG: tyrosine-type recombinase/integrase [Phycisphaerae bacterium]|nr:tyrosine-type recombinase/integrase [Planctomycetia bacterium]MCL4719513.1 tyrosine-type recombinase/integrase [Phycisphaerae bacterium]